MDLDDYWSPGTHHPAYHLIKSSNLDKMILNNIRLARWVATTTPAFADEIRKYNKNVVIHPNTIDPEEDQYVIRGVEKKNDRVRIGWLGGSCFDDQTEILTEDGYKLFSQLHEDDKVLSLDPETNEYNFVKPTSYIKVRYEGLLNCASTQGIDYAVTPNHNMAILEEDKVKLIPSEKIHGTTFTIPKRYGINETITPENQSQREYKGFVYCVEVPTHIIYVRRNGKSMFCGNSHKHDLDILTDNIKKLHGDKLTDQVRFYLCGYDLRGTVTMIDPNTKEQKQRPIQPKESVWYEYEKMFTNNFTTVSPKYKEWLHKFEKNGVYDSTDEPYERVWTKPITTYATNYNNFDIALAPLEENLFNKVKSQLKVIESGFFKKALIAQNYGPYKIDCISAWEKGSWNPKGNALLVDSVKNHKEWYEHMKRLIKNPNAAQDLGEKLYETVKDRYHINTVTHQRKDFYLALIESQVEEYIKNQYEMV
jgi:glycosyltransferase involved in cell wall biosynthesis